MFDTLDHEQQLAFWEGAAQQALQACGLAGASLHLLAYTSSAVYAVQQGDDWAVLRLQRLGRVNPAELESELLWLDLLSGAGLPVPRPRPVGPALYITLHLPGAAGAVYATLFDHLPGQARPPEQLTPDDMAAVGRLLARLHGFAQGFTPPPGFARPRLDWEGLFGERSPYNPGPAAALFTPQMQRIFAQVAERVREAMQALGQGPQQFGMIHGDLLAKNLLFHEGQAAALDFEYCGPGYYLYDLTPLLWQLRSDARWPELEAALWQSYTALRPQPEGAPDLLETLIAGRHLASCRWLASNTDHAAIRGQAPALLAARTDELRAYLESGLLRRSGVLL